jgi:hypothetical protein
MASNRGREGGRVDEEEGAKNTFRGSRGHERRSSSLERGAQAGGRKEEGEREGSRAAYTTK